MARGWKNTDPLEFYDRGGNLMECHPFRDMWRQKAGFLVGAGPSLKTIDYMRLAERGVVSLGLNNVAGLVPVSAMTFGDPPSKFHYGIHYDPCIWKFVPKPKLRQKIRLKHPQTREFVNVRSRVRGMPSVWAFRRECKFVAKEFLTAPWASWGNNNKGVEETGGPKTLNTSLFGFRLMHYLGVRRLYLLGFDFTMHGAQRQQGNYAFGQAGSPVSNNNAYKVLVDWLTELKPIFDADGFEVYNCNPDSALTVFPHVPFENAFQDCKAPVPEEPFDLEGWYEASEDKQKKNKDYDPDG